MQLNGSGIEALAEAAHMSHLTPNELKSGRATMPAFRSLYLDHVFSGDDLRVTRNTE